MSDTEHSERIRRWQAAYEAANGHPAPAMEYHARRYRTEGETGWTTFTGPEIDAAIAELEKRAA